MFSNLLRKKRFYLFKAIISLLLLFFVYRIFNIELLKTINKIDVPILGLAILSRVLWMLVGSLRWFLILHGLERSFYSYKNLFLFNLQGLFVSLFLPSNIGGDGWRIIKTAPSTGLLMSSVAVFLDRGLSVVFLIILAGKAGFCFTLLSSKLKGSISIFAIASLSLVFMVFVYCFRKKFINYIKEAFFGFLRICQKPILCALIILLSGGSVYFVVESYRFSALAVGLQQPLSWYFSLVPLLVLSRALPISLSGIGVGEAFAVVLLQGIVSPDIAVIFAFLGFFSAIPLALIGGVSFLLAGK